MVVIGALLIVVGMGGLYIQHVLRAGTAGWVGFIVLAVGALALAAGATTIDVFLLPTLFKLVNQIPNVGAQIQSAYNQVQQGVNTVTSTTVNTGSNACNTVAGVFGQSCGSTTAPAVPSATVPVSDAPTFVNDLLVLLGFPSLATLGIWGLSFLSGASLAPGCLLLSLVFLFAGLRPRSALVLVAVCAVLNLGGQFLLPFAFLRHLSGLLLFLSMAWLGVRLWFPQEVPLPFLTSWYDQEKDRLGLRRSRAFLLWAREQSQPRSPFTKAEVVTPQE